MSSSRVSNARKSFQLRVRSFWLVVIVAVVAAFALSVRGQKPADQPIVYHRIEGRLRIHNAPATSLRVRLVREDQHRPIGETFTRSRGEFEFPSVPEGDYLVETLESDELEATSTRVLVRPFPRERSTVVHVDIEIPEKSSNPVRSGVIAADVDLNAPKEAVNHYHNGIKAIGSSNPQRALKEFQSAIAIFPEYYAARLELGRELRFEKRFAEAEEVLRPLIEIAPKHAEAWIENGIVLLELKRRDEAAEKLETAVQCEETSWAAHLYLGWALLEAHASEAAPHFERALELNQQKAARAHLALARLAEAKGQRQLAIQHLETYLTVHPEASDAEMTRRLLDNLRKPSP